MKYKNLKELLYNSSASRKYFFALESAKQIEIHNFNESIHTLFDLMLLKEKLDNYTHKTQIANILFNKHYSS